MKRSRVLTIISLMILLQVSWGAIPNLVKYQGVLKDSNSDLVTGPREITFRLYDALTGGTEWWSETHSNVQVTDGIFQVELGSVVNWFTPDPSVTFDRPFWLEIQVTGDTGPLAPRTQLLAVPYAASARGIHGSWNELLSRGRLGMNVAGTADTAKAVVITTDGRLGIGTTQPERMLHIKAGYAEGIQMTDSLTGNARAELVNFTDNGAVLNLRDVNGTMQARIRGYPSPFNGVQAFFTGGKVGIGTTTPLSKFQVEGES
ncbi:MAG: hypothetical protein JSW54_02555, partial [Fidelibacterota bacterium]